MPKVSGVWEEKGETEENTVCEVDFTYLKNTKYGRLGYIITVLVLLYYL